MTSSTFRRVAAAVAGVALLALPLTACGSKSGPPKPVASITDLKGQTTAVKLDAGFVGALKKLHLKPGTIGRGKLVNGSLVFPITGGNVTVFKPGQVSPYVIGQIQHEGSGLSLSAGGTKVSLTDLNVDPGVSRIYGNVAVNGKPVVGDAYLFKLDGRTLKSLKTKGNTAILEGTKVEISPVAAQLLDQTFKTQAVKGGLLVGIAKITVKVK